MCHFFSLEAMHICKDFENFVVFPLLNFENFAVLS